jgi:lipopolysaccharide export system protein LptA
MKIPAGIVHFVAILTFFFLACPRGHSHAQVSKAPEEGASRQPIVIHSNTLEVDQKKQFIVFEGKVRAEREGMVVDCQKMLVYYREGSAMKEAQPESRQIDRIVALGDVSIRRPDGSVARAGKAVFYQTEEKVVLTEDPFVQQGQDTVEGNKIVLYLNENRSIVEGNERQRVKATIFPKEEKGR